MNQLRRLQVLAAVDDTGAFTSAARTLGMTQSAVSQHIAALEHDVGTGLVDRRSRPVQLTQVGVRLAQHGRAISSQLALAEQEVSQLLGLQPARLRVGAFPSALTTFVPTALRRFRRVRPEVELSLLDGHMPQLLGLLDSGAIDLAIVYGPVGPVGSAGLGPERGEGHPLCDDPFQVVLPRGHRLAGSPSIRLDALADEQWIGSRSNATWFRIVVEACRAEGFTPRVVLTTDDYLGVQAMVASTLGIAVMPGLAVRSSRQLVTRPIGGPPVVRRVWAIRSPHLPDSPVVNDLVSSLQTSANH
jgi:DNA-binding transcriptional LysR family regulator